MPKITLSLKKTLEQNAEVYYEKAKKSRKKIDSIKEIIEKSRIKLEQLKRKEEIALLKEAENKVADRKKEWYEKFRWFVSSEGFLVIGGRDATTNEIIIKKHTDKNDLVMHTDMAGSPFFVIKTEGKKPTQTTIQETADAVASYSRAWKLGLSTIEVFYVKPEQVSKKTKAGEYMPKGAFMIYGETNYLSPEMGVAVGMTKEGMVMGGPPSAVRKHCAKYVELQQGRDKTSEAAKKIRAKIGGELDDIIKCMPAGGVQIKK